MAIGRVSHNMQTRKLLNNIQKQITHQERLFEQISSNKKILRASDDPIGAGKAMNLRDTLGRLEGYEKQIAAAQTWTNISTGELDSAVSMWREISRIATSAGDGTKTDADRQGMAAEVEKLLGGLVSSANAAYGGRYLFGGSATDAPPFEVETDPNTGRIVGVHYDGNSEDRQVKTKDRGMITVNVLGSNGGSPDKQGAFIDSNTGVNLFQHAIELRDKLLNNDIVGISGAGGVLEKIDQGAEGLTTAQVLLAGSQEVLDLDKNRLIEESATVEGYLSELENADVAALILDLNNAQNTYEAALASGGRILQRGLLNFI